MGDGSPLIAKPYYRNPRQITKKRVDRLTDTLDRLGDLSGIVHNIRTDEIIGGNQRTAVFREASEVQIIERYDKPDRQGTVAHGFIIWRGGKYAYRQVDWDEETAAEANIAANVGAGDWDWDVFANQWEPDKLMTWGFDVDLQIDWGRNYAALGNFLESEEAESQDAPPQINKAEELREKWGVQSGQLWRLPSRTTGNEHRLICGDCTDAGAVDRVMMGEKADFCFTDPPYNVGKVYTEETDDNRSKQGFTDWCHGWLEFCPRPLLLTVGVKRLLWWENITGEPDWTAAWIKKNGQSVTGFGGTNKWDPVLCYGVTDDSDIDIVEISNDYSENIKHSGGHPTAKPVKLWEYFINRFCTGGLIYEPFSGSGTTLIAAENLSRQCRAIEIAENYVAVALERYKMAFGITAELVK